MNICRQWIFSRKLGHGLSIELTVELIFSRKFWNETFNKRKLMNICRRELLA